MEFKKAIQIKRLVNEFNKIRDERGRLPLAIRGGMFDMGKWSVDIYIPTDGCLFSRECSELFPMLSQLDCSFFIGTAGGDAVIYIQ